MPTFVIARRLPNGKSELVEVTRPYRTAAPVFDCAYCGKPIGASRLHILLIPDLVVHPKCWSRNGGKWLAYGTRAGIAAELRS